MLFKHNKTGVRLKIVSEWDEGDWFMVEDQDGRIFTVYKTEIVEDKEAITPIIVKKHEDNLYDYTTNTKRLERIIANCKKRQIEVFLVEMPVYKTYYNSLKVEKRDRVSTTLETLDQAHKNVHYLKLSQDPRFKDKDLRDADHLTNEGAEKASKILNNFIMEQLPNR